MEIALASRMLARIAARGVDTFGSEADGGGARKGRPVEVSFGAELNEHRASGLSSFGAWSPSEMREDAFGGIDLNRLAAQAQRAVADLQGAQPQNVGKTVTDLDKSALMLQRPTGQLSSFIDWVDKNKVPLIIVGVVLGGIVVTSLVTSAAMLTKLGTATAAAAV